ncbi:hypothetical protein AMATHDRAFT_42038 [Amanita thiersii Skay4041]|uniref:DUF6533 domain-containing protein n=1 Tax=Amanita thiersii Skay4041 TaxID=703135 RepID=A0A2A9NK90_9AGAR|nr:hypothetical protein AMATHDRAFT_42038 [Amanita thiersii Skay4041]
MINDTLRYCEVSAATIFFLDYFLTLDSEITLIWKSNWGVVKALFLIMRYMPLMDITLRLYHQFVLSISHWNCVLSGQIVPVSITIGLAAAECLLAVRTWCLWHRRRVVGILIFSLATGSFISTMVLIVQYLISVKYVPSPFSTQILCKVDAVRKLFIAYAILLGLEITLLFATITAGINMRRLGSPGFTKIVVRDGACVTSIMMWILSKHAGIFYYIYLGALSAVNMVLLAKQTEYSNSLVFLHRVLHSVLAARVVFNLRANTHKGTCPTH